MENISDGYKCSEISKLVMSAPRICVDHQTGHGLNVGSVEHHDLVITEPEVQGKHGPGGHSLLEHGGPAAVPLQLHDGVTEPQGNIWICRYSVAIGDGICFTFQERI